MRTLRSMPFAFLFAVLLAGLLSAPARAQDSPLHLLQGAADEVLQGLRQDNPADGDTSAIYALVERHIVPLIDFNLVSRYVLGRHWRQADATQRVAFAQAFKALLMRTYATALSDYQDQELRFVSERIEDDGRRALVKSAFVQSGEAPIDVDYRMYRTGAGWRVYDVVIEGVSLVMTYRGSFSQQIRQVGLDGLIHNIRNQS